MSGRSDLLESIVNTIKDYRAGEIPEPAPEHVDKWAKQFNQGAQLPLLRELSHVLKQTYLSKEFTLNFLTQLVTSKKLAGSDHCAFWRKSRFLRIQKNGRSQEEMLAVFDEGLEEQCGISIADCGRIEGDYIYVDDVMFSGNRVGNDLEQWIESDAPAKATVHVIVAALHTSGEWLVGNRLQKAVAASRKAIAIKYWRAKTIENRKSYKNNSEVLWPTAVPDDPQVKKYLDKPHKFPFEARQAGGRLGPFSSETGRQVLEREFLIAGVKILALSKNPSDILRPLGFSPFGLGFGSIIATFRNCPNNCPLAI